MVVLFVVLSVIAGSLRPQRYDRSRRRAAGLKLGDHCRQLHPGGRCVFAHRLQNDNLQRCLRVRLRHRRRHRALVHKEGARKNGPFVLVVAVFEYREDNRLFAKTSLGQTQGLLQTVVFLSAVPMFVPSLSW
jgi:hypothetical protein